MCSADSSRLFQAHMTYRFKSNLRVLREIRFPVMRPAKVEQVLLLPDSHSFTCFVSSKLEKN